MATVMYLNYLLRTYDGVTKQVVATQLRNKALNKDERPQHNKIITGLKSIAGSTSRQIANELKAWPIWTEWGKEVPGIGPFIAGNLIRSYYYKFIPICKKCGADLVEFKCPACKKAAKDDGLLEYRAEDRFFRSISSFWKFMGEHNDPKTGRMARRKKGAKSSWSSRNRMISWQIGEQINRQKPDHEYKKIYLKKKELGKKHMQAIRETRKLFLAHFIMVAKEIAGEELPDPYGTVHCGEKHSHIIRPFYWKPS